MDDLSARLMAAVAKAGNRPSTIKALAKQFEIPEADYAEFRKTVRELVKTGKLDMAKDKTIRVPDTKGLIVGTFRRSSRGFGFVRPQGSAPGQKADQIYIAPDHSRDASTGDQVAVRLTKRPKGPGYNSEGRVVQVLSRASGLFVGTYFERAGLGFVKIDGTTFSAPLLVGDPGAKGAKPGDKVALEMVRYPSPVKEGEGVITEVLGPRGQPGVDTLSVIRALGIPDTFDDDALQEARERAKEFDDQLIGGRTDLRGLLTVTIDPATARDFDDAITLSKDEKGFWSLGVHIADVSHFVRPNSELDRTARTRGTSVYLPDRVIPMLPEIISNSLASLQADHTRYTLSAFMEFDPEGRRTDKQFARTAIRVDRRFSYEQAFAIMKGDVPTKVDDLAHAFDEIGDDVDDVEIEFVTGSGEEAEAPYVSPELVQMLGQMLELAMILRRRRFKRGALELHMPEVEIDLGDAGQVTGAHLASTDVSHQVIEEFMLAANEAVAEHLTAAKVGFLRRGHPDPEPKKLDDFAEFVRGLGFTIDQPQSRFELQNVLAEASKRPEADAVHYAMLRSLKQANYTPEREGHYALASLDYCHFTSPIRRYPDLQVHRQLVSLLAGQKPKSDADELAALAEHCTRTERRAEAAEREIIKIKLLTHLATRIGEAFQAVIIAVEDFGFFARLVELPAEGLVHITGLGEDYFYLEAGTHSLVGRRSGTRYRLGDRLTVRVARVDVDRRELDLALAVEGEETPELPPSTTARPDRPRVPKLPTSAPARGGRKPTKASSKKAKGGDKGKSKRKGRRS